MLYIETDSISSMFIAKPARPTLWETHIWDSQPHTVPFMRISSFGMFWKSLWYWELYLLTVCKGRQGGRVRQWARLLPACFNPAGFKFGFWIKLDIVSVHCVCVMSGTIIQVSRKSSMIGKKMNKYQNERFYLQNLLDMSAIFLDTQIKT